ncbi:MAG: ElyC/SanA/YdcF family protein [Candidatus Paceibacterota bacterium]
MKVKKFTMLAITILNILITLFVAWIVVVIVICNFLIYGLSSSYIYDDTDHVPKAEAVLIPGAAIRSDRTLSQVFKARVDKAIELYEEGKVKKILVSGDNSTVWHNEVNPVRDYLLKKNIPDQDIFLDHAGFDTYSSMYRARDIFHVESIIIVSQPFHLPRAVFIARFLHIRAFGVPADEKQPILKNQIREIFANEKAFLDLSRHRRPKFLGDPIPISGDGRNYE